MNAILRHYSLRLWSTAFVGGLICLVVLPTWQRVAGIDWAGLPAVIILAGCFFLLGWILNRLGVALIRRQVAEAAVWERAGMVSQAEGAFERVKALFDGFWLSPRARRRSAPWITMRMARFYLTQSRPTPEGQAIIMAYLRLHPTDKAVAAGWLESTLHQDEHSPEEQELAVRIGEALPDHIRVQQMLMQLCLIHRRADFEAIQIYRRLWRSAAGLSDEMSRDLARVLLNEAYIDDWALQVYLKAYALGESGCLEGIAAGLHHLKPNVENSIHLEMARQAISGLDEERRLELRRQFVPPREIEEQPEPVQSTTPLVTAQHVRAAGRLMEAGGAKAAVGMKVAGRGLASLGRVCWQVLKIGLRQSVLAAKALFQTLASVWQHTPKVRQAATALWQEAANGSRVATKRWQENPKARRAARVTMIAVASILIIAAAWRWIGPSGKSKPASAPPAAQTQPTPAPTNDAFTIQVAAYLKPEDARRFVDRLKQNHIDAFWVKAVSANRAWYQVKVSHFATKDEAVKYGETLKAKGLIDDFYVANYSR